MIERMPVQRLAHGVTGRLSAWFILASGVVLAALAGGLGGPDTTAEQAGGLPAAAESAEVEQLRRQLPAGRSNPALVVYSRAGGLTAEDRAAISADVPAFAAVAQGGPPSRPVFSDDGSTALVSVPLPADAGDGGGPVEQVRALRAATRAGLPAGLSAQVTGGAGFAADIASSFDGANVTLLLVTVSVVATLLLLTYRSPVLWLVPLAVVGSADVVANALLRLLSAYAGLQVGPSTVGITDVLVFGAGTNYALLLIARYREELHRHEDRRTALRIAWRGAAPAIAASAATVVLSLLALGAADLQGTRAIGYSGAAGITVAAAFGLLVLPAVLAVCGRGLFWPFVPRIRDQAAQPGGGWHRIGTAVARRPRTVAAFAMLLLGILAAGLLDTQIGLSRAESFRIQAESIEGLRTLARTFPAGAADPVIVLSPPGAAERVRRLAAQTPGVAAARPGEATGTLAETVVTLSAAPDTEAGYTAIRALRDRLAGTGALVGGTVPTNLDVRQAARRDLQVVVPLVLIVVVVVLLALLRSVVAAGVLVATVVATYFAALGAGTLAFRHVFDYPGLDVQVPLLAFLFLVALGVDYNIFLATRAREEAPRRGTRDGMIRALAVTGGVITSAGILLAAVFAVLGVLPLITLTQIGVIVGFGVLLDTLLVRTVLVPAIATILGGRFWWPSRIDPAARAAGPHQIPVGAADTAD